MILDGGIAVKIVNNIFNVPNERSSDGFQTGQIAATIRNNLFINLGFSAAMAANWGVFDNNMILHCEQAGFWNAQNSGQPLVPDYNLLWDFQDVLFRGGPMRWGNHNILNQEPLFEQGSYRLRNGSPGINQGDPSIQDLDGTRSDIGVYGGPYAY